MESSIYMKNRQKLLFMVHELHELGFKNLRIVPSLSPSGLSWRCEFVNDAGLSFGASNWIFKFEKDEKQINHSPRDLAEMFLIENSDFLENCKGDNKEYPEWYRLMILNLKEGELPFAFADYHSPSDFWETSKGNKIKTLPGEKKYYSCY